MKKLLLFLLLVSCTTKRTAQTWPTKPVRNPGRIVSPDSANTEIVNLVPGVYQYQLTVTDSKGNKYRDTVKVTVLPRKKKDSFPTGPYIPAWPAKGMIRTPVLLLMSDTSRGYENMLQVIQVFQIDGYVIAGKYYDTNGLPLDPKFCVWQTRKTGKDEITK